MDADINHADYKPENDPQFRLDTDTSKREEKVAEQEQPQKIPSTYGPRNDLEWKVHDSGVNQIQRPAPLVLRTLKERSISLQTFGATLDAEAFARYARWDAWHQNLLNQLHYAEERLKLEREAQADNSLPIPIKEDIEKQMERIDIQRLDAA